MDSQARVNFVTFEIIWVVFLDIDVSINKMSNKGTYTKK